MLLFCSTTLICRHLSPSITVSASSAIRAVVSAAIFGKTRANENGVPAYPVIGMKGFRMG